MTTSDEKYLEIILNKINICKTYKPRFGQGTGGLSLAEFQTLYGNDAFYSWFGLDTPLMYAAHRAAGGITSVYRQIGIGCETVFRLIIQDTLNLSEEQSRWSYTVTTGDGERTLSLDAKIQLDEIPETTPRQQVNAWLKEAAEFLQIAPEIRPVLKGAVFEVRQGYKSKDSKRQNADIANAATAYSQGYVPVLGMLSVQIDGDVAHRYEGVKWLVLRGHLGESPLHSTYAFTQQVLGYDLAGFFERHSSALKAAVLEVLETLLGTDG